MPSIDDLDAYIQAHSCPSPSFLVDMYADNTAVDCGLGERA
jgi:hypothetical protein